MATRSENLFDKYPPGENEEPDFVSQLVSHYQAIGRLIARHYTSTVDKEQALLRLHESEMWISKARRKVEGPHGQPSGGQPTG